MLTHPRQVRHGERDRARRHAVAGAIEPGGCCHGGTQLGVRDARGRCLCCGRGNLAGQRRRAAKALLGHLDTRARVGGTGGAFGGGEPLPRRVVRGDGRFGDARGRGFPRLRRREALGSGCCCIAGRRGSDLSVRALTAGPVKSSQGRVCGSAWNVDPLSGGIGVQN